MLGARQRPLIEEYDEPFTQPSSDFDEPEFESEIAAEEEAKAKVAVKKVQASELEKAVRRMPTLYVIAFFGVVVACAVLMIWNTLQVNKLTLERTRLTDKIAESEQRLIRLRAEEMQLSAPNRIRELAKTKLGMVDATGEELVIVH